MVILSPLRRRIVKWAKGLSLFKGGVNPLILFGEQIFEVKSIIMLKIG